MNIPAYPGILCYEWRKYKNRDELPFNGIVANKWGLYLQSGDILYEGGDVQNRYSPLDYFLLSFPMEQLQLYLRETNINLRNNRKREANTSELYKLFGIMVLITWFETTSRV